MARPLRIEKPGGWYHITARGNERKSIFRDDRDRERLLELIAEMIARFRVRLHCYVLMDNHYHLVLELSEANLSRAVQWFLGRRLCGMKLADLAKAVGLRNYGVVATNVKRCERRLERDRAERARLKQVCQLLKCEV